MRFRNRSDAGQRLATRLQFLRGEDVVVLGLPRGGVPVAAEVARTLRAPLQLGPFLRFDLRDLLLADVGVPHDLRVDDARP